MLPVMRGAIARMGSRLPDKRRAANPIRQTVPLSGQAEPDRPLVLTTARNRPALGASSCDGGRDSGPRSNREGWLGKVWKGRGARSHQCAPPFRCSASDGDAVGGGPCPRGDRTQISEAPQVVESLNKCTLRGADFRSTSLANFGLKAGQRQPLRRPGEVLPQRRADVEVDGREPVMNISRLLA